MIPRWIIGVSGGEPTAMTAPTQHSQDETRAVILGAGGMLGRVWRDRLDAGAVLGVRRARLYDRSGCDVTSLGDLERAITPGVRLVVNCAAWTDVDGAERDEDAATRLNGIAVGMIAARCRDVGAVMVHYSTDYVFNGEASTPYATDHPIEPVNAYGRSKAAGERLLRESGAAYLLLRTSWLYAANGKNFVRTIARLCAEKPTLRVVDDQVGRPTSCDSLVGITAGLIAKGARGVYHACDGGECSWFGFARAIAERVNPACVVEPCATSEFPRPARRPAYSVLDLAETEELLGRLANWREPLAEVLSKIEHATTADQ